MSTTSRSHPHRRPKVVMIVENESVPTDRRVWDEASVLAADGFDVSVICPMGSTDDHDAFERIDGIDIHRFPLQPAAGGAKDFLREYAEALAKILRLLWKQPGPVAVVHVSNPPDFLFTVALAAKLRWRSKIVFDHHDLSPELFESRFGSESRLLPIVRLVERLNFRVVDAVISTNDSYRQLAISRGGVDADRVNVVRNARNRNDFYPVEPEPELKRGKPLMAVYVGAMGPQDGADCAVRVAAEYRALGRDDLHVVMVGDGDAKVEAEELAKALGVDDMVEFVGWQKRDAVIRYLSTADIGLATDPPNPLNDHSTMIKVIEYMAMGLPVVSFDLAESQVTAADAALYSHGLDEADMAANLARLADDPALRQRLGDQALSRTAGPLSWETSRRSLLDVYHRILGITPRNDAPRLDAAVSPAEVPAAPPARSGDPVILAVTPAHNEGPHIKELIESVAAQTMRPTRWVIVDDASTDDTFEQITAHAADHAWITPIRRNRSPERRLSAKAETVAFAYDKAIELCPEAEFVVSMDADIVVPEHAFAFLVDQFDRSDRLGVAGGVYQHPVGDEMVVNRISDTHVPGPMQFFRRSVFDAIGGYQPLGDGGLDVVSTAHARMLGWETRPFPELVYTHSRRMGTGGDRHPLAAEFRSGIRDHTLGSSLVFETIKCAGRVADDPPVLAAAAHLGGYVWAAVSRRRSHVDPDVARFIRSEQNRRLKPKALLSTIGRKAANVGRR